MEFSTHHPGNILLSKKGHCKISDFGVSHLFSDEELSLSHGAHTMAKTEGTYHFLAPECLEEGQ